MNNPGNISGNHVGVAKTVDISYFYGDTQSDQFEQFLQSMPADLILSAIWACLISLVAVPSIINVARKKGLLDKPNGRTIHSSPTPRLGGLAIFAGFVSALTIFGDLGNGVQMVLAGCVLIMFVGLKDDLVSVSPFTKFFVQLLAAGIVVFMADIRISSFQGFLGVEELDIGSSYAFTFLLIIGITNAINLLDGLDGLAGSIVFVISIIFGVYFYLYGGNGYSNYAFLAFCLMGSLLGFLRYNFHRAVIFMGDTGSLVCGFIISVLTIQFIEMDKVESTPSLALGILIIPVVDTLRVFVLRILKGLSPFMPDKNHIHHRLIGLGLSQPATVCILVLINLAFVGLAVGLAGIGDTRLVLLMFALALSLTLFLRLVPANKNA